jgi:RNA 3'-terminal phosphate cyclase
MTDTVKLLPCPFCGARGITHRNSGLARWVVSCTRCDCKPLNHMAQTETEAIAARNNRPATVPKRIADGLAEALEDLHLKSVIGTDIERHAALNKAFAVSYDYRKETQ